MTRMRMCGVAMGYFCCQRKGRALLKKEKTPWFAIKADCLTLKKKNLLQEQFPQMTDEEQKKLKDNEKLLHEIA